MSDEELTDWVRALASREHVAYGSGACALPATADARAEEAAWNARRAWRDAQPIALGWNLLQNTFLLYGRELRRDADAANFKKCAEKLAELGDGAAFRYWSEGYWDGSPMRVLS